VFFIKQRVVLDGQPGLRITQIKCKKESKKY
jgi:hypothetical protein